MKFKSSFLFVALIMGMGLMQAQTSGKKTAPVRKAPPNEQDIMLEIRELETSLRIAFMDGRTVWWENHLDDHYSGLNAEGKIANKSETIQIYSSSELKYEEINLSNINARIFNTDCVIATGRNAVKGSYKGLDFSGDYYFVHVWIKNGNDWKLASSQTTKVFLPG